MTIFPEKESCFWSSDFFCCLKLKILWQNPDLNLRRTEHETALLPTTLPRHNNLRCNWKINQYQEQKESEENYYGVLRKRVLSKETSLFLDVFTNLLSSHTNKFCSIPMIFFPYQAPNNKRGLTLKRMWWWWGSEPLCCKWFGGPVSSISCLYSKWLGFKPHLSCSILLCKKWQRNFLEHLKAVGVSYMGKQKFLVKALFRNHGGGIMRRKLIIKRKSKTNIY